MNLNQFLSDNESESEFSDSDNDCKSCDIMYLNKIYKSDLCDVLSHIKEKTDFRDTYNCKHCDREISKDILYAQFPDNSRGVIDRMFPDEAEVKQIQLNEKSAQRSKINHHVEGDGSTSIINKMDNIKVVISTKFLKLRTVEINLAERISDILSEINFVLRNRIIRSNVRMQFFATVAYVHCLSKGIFVSEDEIVMAFTNNKETINKGATILKNIMDKISSGLTGGVLEEQTERSKFYKNFFNPIVNVKYISHALSYSLFKPIRDNVFESNLTEFDNLAKIYSNLIFSAYNFINKCGVLFVSSNSSNKTKVYAVAQCCLRYHEVDMSKLDLSIIMSIFLNQAGVNKIKKKKKINGDVEAIKEILNKGNIAYFKSEIKDKTNEYDKMHEDELFKFYSLIMSREKEVKRLIALAD